MPEKVQKKYTVADVTILNIPATWQTMQDVNTGLAQASKSRDEKFGPIIRAMAAENLTAQMLGEKLRAECPEVALKWPTSEKTRQPVGLGHQDLRGALPAFNCFLTYLYGYERDDKGIPLLDPAGKPRPKVKGSGRGISKEKAPATETKPETVVIAATETKPETVVIAATETVVVPVYNRASGAEKAMLVAMASRLDAARATIAPEAPEALEALEEALEALIDLFIFFGLSQELPY